MKIYKWKLKLFRTAVVVIGAFVSGAVWAQVAGTAHNLGTGTGGSSVGNTDQVCVFCHTPHGSATAAVPLWNKTLPAATTFTTYNSVAANATTSLDGTVVNVGSVSIACLSCHDGVQAMDSMINEPGSGTGTITNTNTQMTAGIAVVGQDLQNDHPIGIQYAGGGIVTGSPDSFVDADFVTPQEATLNGQTVWWVDTEATGNGTRQKTDMILYTRVEAAAANAAEPFVECASCHDPHEATNATFLRIPNANSDVCLACHTK